MRLRTTAQQAGLAVRSVKTVLNAGRLCPKEVVLLIESFLFEVI